MDLDIQLFDGITDRDLTEQVYENCVFRNSNFQEANLTQKRFIDCRFEDCNLSMCVLIETAFREVYFLRCKMFTMPFDQCNGIGMKVEFDHCALDGTNFQNLKMGGTRFIHCILYGVDFTNTYLSGAIFDTCDLMDARFDNTCLEKADFRTARDFEFDPEQNIVTGARFSRLNLAGLLRKYRLKLE